MNAVSYSRGRGLRFVSCVQAPLGSRRDLAQDAPLPPCFFKCASYPCAALAFPPSWSHNEQRWISSPGRSQIESWDSVSVRRMRKWWRACATTFVTTQGYWKIHSIGAISTPHLTLMSHRLRLFRCRTSLALWNLTWSPCLWSSCTLISLTGSS